MDLEASIRLVDALTLEISVTLNVISLPIGKCCQTVQID